MANVYGNFHDLNSFPDFYSKIKIPNGLPIDLSQILSIQIRCVHKLRSEFSILNLDSLRSAAVDTVHTTILPRVESKMIKTMIEMSKKTAFSFLLY